MIRAVWLVYSEGDWVPTTDRALVESMPEGHIAAYWYRGDELVVVPGEEEHSARVRWADGHPAPLINLPRTFLHYAPGVSRADLVHSRASAASYLAFAPWLRYVPGESGHTHTRASAASYLGHI